MTREAVRPAEGFRRFYDSIARRNVLVPHLEAALATRGDRSWPDEFPIKVDNKEREFDGYFHPSSHAGMPGLLLYYTFHPEHRLRLEVARETPRDVMTLLIGSALHSVTESLLLELGFAEPVDIEPGFRDEVRMCSGQPDVLRITLPALEEHPMVEIKTIARLPRAPLPAHVVQVQPYMDLAAECRDWCILLYIEKAWPHAFAEFKVERDDDLLDGIYSKWRAVRDALDLSDPSLLSNCGGCEPNNKVHANCEARMTCRIGPPMLTRGRRTA